MTLLLLLCLDSRVDEIISERREDNRNVREELKRCVSKIHFHLERCAKNCGGDEKTMTTMWFNYIPHLKGEHSLCLSRSPTDVASCARRRVPAKLTSTRAERILRTRRKSLTSSNYVRYAHVARRVLQQPVQQLQRQRCQLRSCCLFFACYEGVPRLELQSQTREGEIRVCTRRDQDLAQAQSQ